MWRISGEQGSEPQNILRAEYIQLNRITVVHQDEIECSSQLFIYIVDELIILFNNIERNQILLPSDKKYV